MKCSCGDKAEYYWNAVTGTEGETGHRDGYACGAHLDDQMPEVGDDLGDGWTVLGAGFTHI